MTKYVRHLEEMLCLWEETCLAIYGLEKYKGVQSDVHRPAINWPELRPYLLRSLSHERFDKDRFLPPGRSSSEAEAMGRSMLLSGSFLSHFPAALWSWCKSSRRVYSLSEDLTYLLRATSLRGLTWKDVSWPFESFCVHLQVPIEREGGPPCDFILVSKEIGDDGNPHIGFRLFSKKSKEPAPYFSREKKRTLLKMIERGNLVQYYDQLRSKLKRIEKGEGDADCFYLGTDLMDVPVMDALAERIDLTQQRELDEVLSREPIKDFSHWDAAARLVVGLCMYLTMMPNASPHLPAWRKVERSPSLDPQAVINEAEICTVGSVYTLTQQERDYFDRVLRDPKARAEMEAHFRGAHWRRPPGLGHDPTARKTVWVRPTIVLLDRLPEGSLPKGTGQLVT